MPKREIAPLEILQLFSILASFGSFWLGEEEILLNILLKGYILMKRVISLRIGLLKNQNP
ncbi:hypothetical protein CH371_00495 [Leptospira wolffii]|uniref:Uncharacterized protein n=1 Tax=Leptospira wolffii TaxID=409998 RepID=A0A2M9ZDZ2_9LEPT|nr:hypothetical protein CH371_00495 [Leptospira wolffii]